MPRLEFPTGRMKFKFDKTCPFYASDRKIFISQTTQQFTELFERFNYVLIVKIAGVETTTLQEIRRALSNQDSDLFSELYIAKHSLTRVAIDGIIENLEKKYQCSAKSSSRDQELIKALKQFKELLVGEIGLLFTNCEDYSTLKNVFLQHTSFKTAKVGSIVKENVYFEGRTGLTPHMITIFHCCNVVTRIRMGRIDFPYKQRILAAGEVISKDKVIMLNALNLKVIQERVEPVYVFSKTDACVVPDEVLDRDYFENCVEAANHLTALSKECSLVNELTVMAEIKKGIWDLLALDTETMCEMRYGIRVVQPQPILNDNDEVRFSDSTTDDDDMDIFGIFA
ncbi:hypothetical protein C9374_001165 [Naegleria lovaniensis]|uniref:Large ribosomal subunit protein uL10-like insertion domain-containing protein n=1 Tax=Naegleria lovaniensis TaxID=51637 RepID=A0AA88GSI4_NAELO|nr:uncharacterized protein C9374_001165 [Naegleria lovaniensis]KAG2387571.1 hypothetical protein C9374_001165 [Naegleria lovaniensis]